jgi:arginyl-tRNA synthetase
MIEDKIRDEISGAVQATFNERINPDKIIVSRPGMKEHGDFSSNVAFKLAKNINANPSEIAEKISKYLDTQKVFEKTENASGFLNIFLKKDHYYKALSEILAEKENYGKNSLFKGRKVQVEFISANPTGPLTMANGRGGFTGDALANIFAWSGAKVEREYYVNDGGNQITTLGKSILVAAGKEKTTEDIYRGEYIEKWIKGHKKEIERYAGEPFVLGQLAAGDILKEYIMPSVKKMGIDFDNWYSEVNLVESGEVKKAIEAFKKNGLTYEKDGALWFRTSKYFDSEDRVLVKSDAEKTYFANDAAYHWDKFAKRKFDKVINIWGADHHGYVERLQAAASAMGHEGELDIIIMQMVRLIKNGQEFKMSKRKGEYVSIDDLFTLIGGKDREASDVARFFFLSRSANTHMDFDLDLAKERSDKNPVFYVKYAYARIYGILDKLKKGKGPKGDLELLTEPAELELIDELIQLPSIVQSILVMRDYPVHVLTFYAIEVASKFHHFYDQCRVIDPDNPKLSAARLRLVEATRVVLSIVGRDLVGIEMPKKM